VLRDVVLNINGEARHLRVDDAATLLDVLRTDLDLKAARFGCGAGQCGTCAVIVDGEEHPACQLEVGNLEGKQVTTLEGIGTASSRTPCRRRSWSCRLASAATA